MPTTRTATATAVNNAPGKRSVLTIHAVTAAWIFAFLAFGKLHPFSYSAALQEDGFVEWLTVGLFAAAGVLRARVAWRERRWFDLLIAAFCMFVAGEEFSWGQRLLGFTPPDVFLEHNRQQEFTLHNFADVFGQPKGVLIMALLGYAVVLPLGRRLFVRLRATIPPLPYVPWFVVAAGLLIWYPLELTGEWVETLAGWLFLLTALPTTRQLLLNVAAAIAAAVLLTYVSARGFVGGPAAIACTEREAYSLLADVGEGNAMTERLRRRSGRVHKRLFTAIEDGYIDASALVHYRGNACGQSQRYYLDPWGMPYWIRVSAKAVDGRSVTVYSMGPNRRRDTAEGGDDILAEQVF